MCVTSQGFVFPGESSSELERTSPPSYYPFGVTDGQHSGSATLPQVWTDFVVQIMVHSYPQDQAEGGSGPEFVPFPLSCFSPSSHLLRAILQQSTCHTVFTWELLLGELDIHWWAQDKNDVSVCFRRKLCQLVHSCTELPWGTLCFLVHLPFILRCVCSSLPLAFLSFIEWGVLSQPFRAP